MNYYYDEYSQSMSTEIPHSKNSLLKTMINLEKFEIGQSYVTCKIKNKENDSVIVNIQGGTPRSIYLIYFSIWVIFVTGSKSGTGLGLYICKNIIEKHGGRIWANNNVDNNGKETKGSTFTFSLPIKNSTKNI